MNAISEASVSLRLNLQTAGSHCGGEELCCLRQPAAGGESCKAEQVPQGLRDIGSSKRTCPLCSFGGSWQK